MRIDELETPCAIVDIDLLRANIARLQDYLDAHRIANRPHVKTHKVPEIAHWQLAAGAVGVTCQKLSEAEVMAQAGIRDIFIPYNMIGASRLARLMRLARRIQVSVTADSGRIVDGLADAAAHAGLKLPVLVEFDSGLSRCGVQSPEEAAALAQQIDRATHLQFAGLMTYPNSANLDEFVKATRERLTASGLEIRTVSGGGTPGTWEAHQYRELTEHRAGVYAFGDRGSVEAGALTYNQCAFAVLATVVSRPTRDRAIIDAGSKALSSDLAELQGFGRLTEYPEASIYRLSEEHGFVDVSQCKRPPVIGERVTIIPNHCCTAVNLFDEIAGVQNGSVEVIWPVAARGKMH